MEFKFQERRGLGSVITTLIILIASVVLGAGVIFFGGSLFQTNTENEAIQVSNCHIWVGTNGTGADAVAANTQKELTWEPNFTLAGYDLDGDGNPEVMTPASGPISLAQGKAAFVFLDSPAGINSLDTGLAFTVNIQAGKASAVQSVSVVSAS